MRSKRWPSSCMPRAGRSTPRGSSARRRPPTPRTGSRRRRWSASSATSWRRACARPLARPRSRPPRRLGAACPSRRPWRRRGAFMARSRGMPRPIRSTMMWSEISRGRPRRVPMHGRRLGFLVATLGILTFAEAHADKYADTIKIFRDAGRSGRFFDHCYGYAVFPSIGKGGIGVGGAHGSGRVYEKGGYVGDTSMNQVTIGFQFGGQAYRQIVFFENKAAFDQFTSGKFEFGAQATAVAITAGASAQASTGGGAGASASGTQHQARTAGAYENGMAVFTVARGGLMYEATIGGQKFGYKPKP